MSPVGVCVLLLSSLGLAVTIQAQVCTPPPAEPHTVLSDADILKEEFPNGADATFKCDIGYASIGGSKTVRCTNGEWSPLRLRCERKDCGSPGEVDNGQFTFQGTEFGDTAVATCNEGYTMYGKPERHCLNEGWSGRIPVCEVKKCNPPPDVENASLNPVKEIYDYRDVVAYSCKNEYTLNGSSSIACMEDGTFKPAPPKCIMVRCEIPNISDAYWDGGARPPYGYRSFVTYKCKAGYNMEGTSSITCNINSKWTPDLPKCVKAPTTTTATTTTTTTTTTRPPPVPKTTSESGRVPVTPKPTVPPHSGGNRIGVGIAIAIGVVGIIGGAIFVAYYFITKKKPCKATLLYRRSFIICSKPASLRKKDVTGPAVEYTLPSIRMWMWMAI